MSTSSAQGSGGRAHSAEGTSSDRPSDFFQEVAHQFSAEVSGLHTRRCNARWPSGLVELLTCVPPSSGRVRNACGAFSIPRSKVGLPQDKPVNLPG